MSISSEITRITNNVQNTIDTIEATGVTVPDGANSDDLPSLAAALANEKQNKLTGTQGQVVGFDASGNAIATEPPSVSAVTFTVTLTAAGWSDNSQTVSDERFAVSGYAYITNPADADFAKWAAAMIRGQDVTTAGQMAFTCEETPAENITVKILRVEAAEA